MPCQRMFSSVWLLSLSNSAASLVVRSCCDRCLDMMCFPGEGVAEKIQETVAKRECRTARGLRDTLHQLRRRTQ